MTTRNTRTEAARQARLAEALRIAQERIAALQANAPQVAGPPWRGRERAVAAHPATPQPCPCLCLGGGGCFSKK